MNINHAKDEEVQGDKLQAIFTRQKELMEKYHHIEERSGLCQTPDCPVNLDDKRGQARIKDFSWRVTEELGEALDAFTHDTTAHFQEELIDGLHFLTELTLLAGKDWDTINPTFIELNDQLETLVETAMVEYDSVESLEESVANFIEQLAMMCNCLKNKPWKQSQMKTDTEAFYGRLYQAWLAYMKVLLMGDLDFYSIVNIYLKKSQVNQFRQRSNY